ncbi:MAG TPA: tripartite tricarboxylate transporter substrate binding protein [Xanthobacteraceae bacterium]|nr:tripartite tricarboxylate transporter substrate binding protein [Xanthobacteraceae bacterium]
MLKRMAVLAAGLLVFAAAPATAADHYPDRPVTIVVGFPPGGASDIMARILTAKLGSVLGQSFVVDNRPGAGGNVAGEFVAHAAPDGYTLLVGNNAILATNISLYSKTGFDPVKDFAPISLIGTQANVLVVNNAVKAHSLAELIALAKANPGKLNFASSGYGLAAHLAGELFKTQAHIDIVHVPYKGSAPALQDVIAGQDQMMFATTSGVMGFLKNGQVRALAVTTLKRTPILPDVPTMDEAGLPGFEATTWHGLVAPAGTPPQIIAALNKAIAETLEDPDIQHKLAGLGIDIAPDTPAQFTAYIKMEIPKWAAVIKASGAKME